MSELLRCEGLEKTYLMGRAEVPVLKGVSLRVAAGETVSIMGASGAGKSTLLHALGGLEKPSAGEVWFEEEQLYKLSERRRSERRAQDFGFVFQAYHLLSELNVLENVVLASMAAGKARNKRARKLLETVGLGHRLEHRPTELSGGEQQRVALARALINEPKVVLADEPTGNLDSKTGDGVLEHLFGLTRAAEMALVVVTHNQDVADRCSRNVVLEDGRVV